MSKRKPNLPALLKKAKAALADLELATRYAADAAPDDEAVLIDALFMMLMTSTKAQAELRHYEGYLDRLQKKGR